MLRFPVHLHGASALGFWQPCRLMHVYNGLRGRAVSLVTGSASKRCLLMLLGVGSPSSQAASTQHNPQIVATVPGQIVFRVHASW